MIAARTYQVRCAACPAVLELPFEPRTPKLCERCYAPEVSSPGDLISRGRMAQRHVSMCENNGGGVEGGLRGSPRGTHRLSDFQGVRPGKAGRGAGKEE